MKEQAARGIFLSYRRDDTAHIAGRLDDHLARQFGRGNVFMDVNSIKLGVDFGDEVRQALEKCAVLLALIGPNWLSSSTKHERRLDDPDDWVVLEIGTALARGMRVVPVLVDGAAAPRAADLPEVLAPLARRNAVRIRHETFGVDVGALLGALSPDSDTLRANTTDRQPHLYVSRVERIVDAIRLGAHPAAAVETDDGSRNRTPPFIEREALADLRVALANDHFVLIVGDSTAGKTRLAFEAMRECLPGHFCVVPEWADALKEGVAEAWSRRPAVLWLDDLERYLGGRVLESAYEDLTDLLDADEVVVLATMRAHEHANFSPRYDESSERGDRQDARAGRTILSRATEIRLERMWTAHEMASAGAMSDDPRIEQALASADRYGLAEVMASGPQLLNELHNAWSATATHRAGGRVVGDPRGAALVTAAVDIRLTGYHRPIPLTVLRDLHEVYLAAHGGPVLRPGSWENAVAWATQPIHATSSLLEPAENECWLAFDYLVDAAARNPAAPPIPDETWRAVIDHATLADAVDVAWQASFAGRPEHAESVAERALARDQYLIAAQVASCLGDGGQEQAAVELLQLTVERAESSGQVSPEDLLAMRRTLAWELGEKVGGHGDPSRALEIARRVVADSAELFGDVDPETLVARLDLARQLGGSGACSDALAVALKVSAQAVDALGADHGIVDSARFEAAKWAGRVKDPKEEAKQLEELMVDLGERPAADFMMALDVAWNLGGALLAAGDPERALSLLESVVDDAGEAFGKAYARTLRYRLTHLSAVAATSEPSAALELAEALVEDCLRVLGGDHLTTLQARYRAASLTAETCDVVAAAQMFEKLHDDVVHILGEGHWLVENVRRQRSQLPGC